jgi:hypothetical protein
VVVRFASLFTLLFVASWTVTPVSIAEIDSSVSEDGDARTVTSYTASEAGTEEGEEGDEDRSSDDDQGAACAAPDRIGSLSGVSVQLTAPRSTSNASFGAHLARGPPAA